MNPPKAVWQLLNAPCREMTRLGSESLDRELGRLERIGLRVHLLYCTPCSRYVRQINHLRTALQVMAAQAESDGGLSGPALPDEVRDRIKQALKDR